jgi:hypothetical protein
VQGRGDHRPAILSICLFSLRPRLKVFRFKVSNWVGQSLASDYEPASLLISTWLRQQQLENLGWVFHRIWSTDWFNRKYEEIDRIVAAYERALSRSAERRDLSVLPMIESPQEDIPDLLTGLTTQRSSLFPPIPKRASIAEYDHSEMKALYDWVASDGRLRTHEEVADEMFQALPFTRRGARIEATLRETIRRHERSRASSTPQSRQTPR